MGGSAAPLLPSVTPTCLSPLAAPRLSLAFPSFYSARQLEGPLLPFVSPLSLEFGPPNNFLGMETIKSAPRFHWFSNQLDEAKISCHVCQSCYWVRIIIEGSQMISLYDKK